MVFFGNKLGKSNADYSLNLYYVVNKMPEFPSFEWFNSSGEIAQWFVVVILIISAILIGRQIHVQTKTRKGANFVKVIEMLNDEKMINSIESLYTFSNLESREDKQGKIIFYGKDELKKLDKLLPVDIKNAVIKVRETYHAVGVMLGSNLIDIIPFLMLQSSQVRDMWNLLSENIENVRQERQKKENDVPHWKGFEYIGEIGNFWSIISLDEKRFLTSSPIFFPKPGNPIFNLRMYLHKKFGKNSMKKNKEKKGN